MMQTDSIAEAAGLLTPDTLSLDTLAIDSLWADSISMPLGSSSLLATADSSLNWFDDSVLYASHWPVTLWGDTLKPFLSLYDQLHDFGVPRSYHVLGDDGVQGLLLGSFLFMLLIYAFSRSYFKTQARRFFIPSNNDSQLNAVKTSCRCFSAATTAFCSLRSWTASTASPVVCSVLLRSLQSVCWPSWLITCCAGPCTVLSTGCFSKSQKRRHGM